VSAASTRRAKARAAVIAYFVLFNVLAAVPTPGTASAARLAQPFEQAELRRWSALFHAIGMDVEPNRLAESYLTFSLALERARALLLVPIQGWLWLTQTAQSWRLFGTPDQYANALTITAHAAGQSSVLYESRNPARRWNAALLEYRRIRAAYNPTRSGPPHTYPALAERLSERVFESMPEAERVSIAFLQSRVPLPGEAPDLAINEAHRLEFSRPRL
jgi:hypothetical protein